MAQGGSSGPTAANPLGLGLSFVDGTALVTVRDRVLADGVQLRALELELAEVDFPLDLEGGAEEFQRRSTRLGHLVLEVDLARIAEALDDALAAEQRALQQVQLFVESGRLVLEGRLGARSTPVALDLVPGPSDEDGVEVHVGSAHVFGSTDVPLMTITKDVEVAVRGALEQVGERAAQGVLPRGPGAFGFDAVGALLWAILPIHGWKVPSYEDTPVRRLGFTSTGAVQIVVGDPKGGLPPPPAEAVSDEVLLGVRATQDQDRLVPAVEAQVSSGALAGAYEVLASAFDADRNPRCFEHLVGIGVAAPELETDVQGRLDDRLATDPHDVLALLLRASLAARGEDRAGAREAFEAAARRLRRQGARRRAGLAYRAAAAQAAATPAEQARLLEETIALRPDDAAALEGLVEVLPTLGRASAAVRAARRLANLSPDPEIRVQAHLTAAALLFEQVEDTSGAKREWDRALKLAPDHPEALEGLARVLTAKGDVRRAASILERLAQAAERDGDEAAAGRLSLRLGDLWRPTDPDAALARYRRAHALAPRSSRPVLRTVETLSEAGRGDEALEVLDDALPALEGVTAPEERDDLLALRIAAGQLYAAHDERAPDAVAQLEAAVSIDPAHPEATQALVDLHLRRGDGGAAADLLSQRAQTASAAGDLGEAVRLWRARLEMADDETARAEIDAQLQAARETHPRDRGLLDLWVELTTPTPTAHVQALEARLKLEDPPVQRGMLWAALGRAFEQADDPVGAIRAYEEAIAASPAEKEAAFSLVRLYRARHDDARLDAALARAATVADSVDKQADLHAERARLLEANGDEGEAWEVMQDALQVRPDDLALLPFATTLALKASDAVAARRLAERRIALQATEPAPARLSAYVDLAKVAEVLGDRDLLVQALQNAYEAADPHSEVGRRLAGRLARELEDREDHGRLAKLQAARSEVDTVPIAERAELALDAARRFEQLEAHADAEVAVKRVIDLAQAGTVEASVVDAALDVLETVALQQPDPGRRARVKVLRAQRSSGEAADNLRLEAAQTLTEAGRLEAAAAVLEDAGPRLDTQRPLIQALADLRGRLGDPGPAAEAFARAAALAEADAPEEAVGLYARAAAAYTEAGDSAAALTADRKVIGLPVGEDPEVLISALDRLETHARQGGDAALLAEVLGRQAELRPEASAVGLLLEKADLHLAAAGQERAGLDALRSAHRIDVRDSEVRDQVCTRLVDALVQVGLFAEQAAVLSEWADRTETAEARAERLFRAAEVYHQRLRDRSMALSRAQAAVRADPQHAGARNLRLELLRAEGRTEALAEALAEEAAEGLDANEASARWLEAATLVAPLDALEATPPDRLERALDLVRRAATAAPADRAPVEAEISYCRALGRPDDELSALGRLVERDLPEPRVAATRLRRAHLLRGALGDDLAAQGELEQAWRYLAGASVDQLEEVRAALPEVTREAYEATVPGDLQLGVLQAQLEVTEQVQDWAAHVQTLLGLVEHSDEADARADLRVRAGEVLEWRLGDGEAAEREYLTALATDPDHLAARRALSQFYVAVDRFGDLAESLGVQALQEVFEGFGEDEPPRRVASAAAALWPELPEGSSERADVQLRLSEIHERLDDSAEVVHALEQVVQTGPRPHQDEALVRLRRLFETMGRDDLLVDVLRRQAERIETDDTRALALAELGEALEWKLGDGQAAEQEYRAALAADPTCAPARLRLAELLSAQDRFVDVREDLGPSDLRGIVDRLLDTGPRDRERVFSAATALAAGLDADARGQLWLDVAAALEASPEDETARIREALELAEEPEPTRDEALARLEGLLRRVGERGALADVLARQAERAVDPDVRAAHLVERAGLLLDAAPSDVTGDEARAEAEAALRQALTAAPEHRNAQAGLQDLVAARGDWAQLHALAGDDALEAARAQAEADGDQVTVRDILIARATLSQGEGRAAALVALVDHADLEPPEDLPEGLELTAEALYREALVADPSSLPAQEGLRALYESQGRFRDIGHVISPAALRTTLQGIERLDEGAYLLPATLALATVLADDAEAKEERVRLLVRAAALHQAEDDEEAAEHALTSALEVEPGHPIAREELSGILVRQGRLEALADVDPALVASVAARASAAGDQEMEIRALRVLATRRQGRAQADTLVLVAALEKGRGHVQAAEEDLVRALERDPDHALARAELEGILWSEGRYTDALARLGAEPLLRRASGLVDDDPERLLEIVAAVEGGLDEPSRAEALELCAAVRRSSEDVDVDAEWRRRVDAIQRARATWDARGDSEGSLRTRLVLVDLARERDDVPALLDALADASRHATAANDRAVLAIEQATLLALTDAPGPARALVEPVLTDPEVPVEHRQGAARILLEDLWAPWSEDLDADDEALELRQAALEALTASAASPDPQRVRWWLELAAVLERLDADSDRVVAAYEGALTDGADGEAATRAHTALRSLYEELGDWHGAERHAVWLAERNDDPDLWVQVSELRAWLDDRTGAEVALQSALSVAPSHAAAHESLLRLAEQTGERASVIERLETWATADLQSDPAARFDRLIRALEIAVEAADVDEAGRLAERALEVGPRDGLAERVGRLLTAIAPLSSASTEVGLLTAAVSGAEEVPAALRLQLVSRLVALDRADEARTVLEAGLHRDLAEEDPLVEQALTEADRLGSERACRWLLTLAERLERGPAARRLRAAAAEHAQAVGELDLARQAWRAVLDEVGAGQRAVDARAALVRLARAADDPRSLTTALLSAVDDAETPAAKAARLVEAATLADGPLDAPGQAEALLRRARRLVPEDEALAERFLAHLRARGRWAEVDAELRERLVGTDGVARARLSAARAALARDHLQDPEKAARLFVEAYEVDPTPPRARAAVEALHRASSFEPALGLVERAVADLGPDHPERERLELERADILEALGRVDDAVTRLGELSETLPGNRPLQHHLRQMLARHRRFDRLAEFLERVAPDQPPAEGLLGRLASARIRAERLDDQAGAVRALRGALDMVEGWMAASGAPMPDDIAPPPAAATTASERLVFDAPLLDLAAQAAQLGASDLRVGALRLYAQSLPEGLAQWRVLLRLATAEREAGDLEAAEFTLRGVVDAIHDADEVAVEDRAEAERSLGALLLDRGDHAGAVQALTSAQELLQEGSAEADGARAEVLVMSSQAHRAAGDAPAAMRALVQARLLDPSRVSPDELEAAIEAAGPSEELAESMARRARACVVPSERAAQLRAAAEVWVSIGQPEASLEPRIAAYEADPSNSEAAEALEAELRAQDRWAALDRLLALRLRAEHLTDDARRTLLLRRADVLRGHLDRADAALELVSEAASRAPRPDALTALAELAHAEGRQDLEQDALARLAALVEGPAPRRRALLAKANSLGPERGANALEQALELSSQEGFDLTPLAEHLARAYEARGDHASLARLWVRVAGARKGAGAAAAFARAAQVRLERLDDRRGAASALEAACRRSKEDLGLRRAALALAESLGDTQRAQSHAQAGRAAAIASQRPAAAVSFARAEARALAAGGRAATELEVWQAVLDLGPSRAAMDDLVVRAREALPPEQVDAQLVAAIKKATSPQLKARLLMARARVLDDPLGRHWEAEGLREDAARLDTDAAPALDASQTPDSAPLTDAEYRTMRSMLDRSGRWSELAELEEQKASRMPSRAARARALVEVAALHRASGEPDAAARAKEVLTRAVALDAGSVEAQSDLLRLQVQEGRWEEARQTLERVDALGGPAWPPPEGALAAADIYEALEAPERAIAALVAGLERDPDSAALRARLARLEPTPARLAAWLEVLDPILDAPLRAEVAVREAEVALAAGDHAAALAKTEVALQAHPRSRSTLAARRVILEAMGAPAEEVVAAWIAEADAAPADEAREVLQSALDAAIAADSEAKFDIAIRLVDAGGAGPGLRAKLAELWRRRGDGEGLRRALDLLGAAEDLEPLTEPERAALSRTLLDAGRAEVAFQLLLVGTPDGSRDELATAFVRGELSGLASRIARALSPADAEADCELSQPKVRARLRACFAAQPDPLGPHALAMLTRCVVMLPREVGLARRLAGALTDLDCAEDAAVEYRALLAREPDSVELLEAMVTSATFDDGQGPRAVLTWIRDGRGLEPPWSPLTTRLEARQLDLLGPRPPLAEALQLAARGVAALLPPVYDRPEHLRPAEASQALAEVWDSVRPVAAPDIELLIDPEGGVRVHIDAGTTWGLTVGEALLAEASPAELRFHLARAAFELEAGQLLLARASGSARQDTLVALAAFAEGEDGPDALATHIDESARRRLAELAPHLRGATELDLAQWRVEVLKAATRVGLLVAADLPAALRGLDRLDPRALGESRATEADRLAAMRRWGSHADLLTWLTQGGYARLRSELG